jgi:membrane fusion protein
MELNNAPSRSGERSSIPLFRIEALAHAGHRANGVVLLARPVSYSVVTLLFVLAAAMIVGFLFSASYTRKVVVQGVLLPAHGVTKVTAMQSGLIAESRVSEGQVVRAGEVLFVLANERQTVGQGNADETVSELLRARRDSLQREQSQLRLQDSQRLEASRHHEDDIGAEIRRITDQIALQQRRVEMALTTLKRYSDLAASNFVSPVQVQDKQAELLDQEQRLGELQRARAASERDLAAAAAEVRDLQVQTVRDQQAAERSVSATEQELTENEAKRQILVRAPTAGTVTAITAEPGQTIGAGQSLASILPAESKLEAELYAPSRAVGFLRPGMDVQLRYQAYSYQKFGQAKGRVREISRTALRPDELSLPGAAANSEPVYRVRVALDRQTVEAYGAEQPLRSGAALDGSIVLDKRHLYEWVLEPLYSIEGHL